MLLCRSAPMPVSAFLFCCSATAVHAYLAACDTPWSRTCSYCIALVPLVLSLLEACICSKRKNPRKDSKGVALGLHEMARGAVQDVFGKSWSFEAALCAGPPQKLCRCCPFSKNVFTVIKNCLRALNHAGGWTFMPVVTHSCRGSHIYAGGHTSMPGVTHSRHKSKHSPASLL